MVGHGPSPPAGSVTSTWRGAPSQERTRSSELLVGAGVGQNRTPESSKVQLWPKGCGPLEAAEEAAVSRTGIDSSDSRSNAASPATMGDVDRQAKYRTDPPPRAIIVAPSRPPESAAASIPRVPDPAAPKGIRALWCSTCQDRHEHCPSTARLSAPWPVSRSAAVDRLRWPPPVVPRGRGRLTAGPNLQAATISPPVSSAALTGFCPGAGEWTHLTNPDVSGEPRAVHGWARRQGVTVNPSLSLDPRQAGMGGLRRVGRDGRLSARAEASEADQVPRYLPPHSNLSSQAMNNDW